MQTVGGIKFTNYGSHCDKYPSLPYFTAAAAIGQTESEIQKFLSLLDAAYTDLKNKN